MYIYTDIMNITHTFLSAVFHHLAVFLKPAFCRCPVFTDFTVNMLFWTNFCSQKLKRRILATFGFNRTPLRATQPKLHSMFCALFLKIALSAAELISFGHLGAAIWHRWTIICGVPSKKSVTPTCQRYIYRVRHLTFFFN